MPSKLVVASASVALQTDEAPERAPFGLRPRVDVEAGDRLLGPALVEAVVLTTILPSSSISMSSTHQGSSGIESSST